MRGDQELKCLNIVKEAIFCKNGQPIENPFTHKTYLDVSDDEFKNTRKFFVNPDCHKPYFGLLKRDQAEFENILRTAKANQDANAFPDFVFDNGFIEHFQITSSKTNKKGSVHKKEESEYERKVESEIKETTQEWNEAPNHDEGCSKTWVHENPEHNHEYLIESFKSNWEHHLESCNKYKGSKEVGIFMVEYSEFALSMLENVYQNWIKGMSRGDMREPEKFICYRLSRDKRLLNYIYEFKDIIKYVIFINCDGFEVIRLENIPYLLNLLPWDYSIVPNNFIDSTSLIYMGAIKVNTKKEKEEQT